ncbi:MAG: orotidine-5'-phosphate decarboxylase [bacterium]
MKWEQKYRSIALKNKSLLCVGLDIDFTKLQNGESQFDFARRIVDETYDLVAAYKPNSAFFEANGAEGINELGKICKYLQERYPEIPIILDAKRGDIGSTNEQYGKFAFEYLGVDAITLQPYAGLGALLPFEKYQDKGLIVLCKTSNPESIEFQEREVGNPGKLWEVVAKEVVKRDAGRGQWNIVFGATHATEFVQMRKIVGNMLVLVPGVGTQGATIADVMREENIENANMIINASRSVIYADNPRAEALKLVDDMRRYADGK